MMLTISPNIPVDPSSVSLLHSSPFFLALWVPDVLLRLWVDSDTWVLNLTIIHNLSSRFFDILTPYNTAVSDGMTRESENCCSLPDFSVLDVPVTLQVLQVRRSPLGLSDLF
jgi:hypothetical protein